MLDAFGPQAAQARPAYARSLAPWTILSISDNDDTTSPHQLFKAWSMIVPLIPVYDILISSQPRHSSAPN